MKKKNIFVSLTFLILTLIHMDVLAQNLKGLPKLPTGGVGFQGSVGAGFADFKTQSPDADFQLDRGMFVGGQLERGFNVMHLYLTLGLNYMDAEGRSNYQYTNLSSSTTYSLTDVAFRSKMYELSLGLKLKLIDQYWFRPYVEGGGLATYNEVTYGSRLSQLNATGSDYKQKDVIMGSGYYGEAGVEIAFNEKFGVRLAARSAMMQTKKLETLNQRVVRMQNEIYYLALMFGI